MARPLSSTFRPAGPALARTRSGRRRWLGYGSALAIAVVAAAYACFRIIGADLHSGAHLGASHGSDGAAEKLPANAVAEAASAKSAAGAPAVLAAAPSAKPAPTVDGAREGLLAAARDHLARKVAPTLYSVEDLRANNGNHLDLVERGLAGQIPLRAAIVRHRARNPGLYGLHGKPALTLDERRRAWNGDNLETFLRAHAAIRPAGDAQPGDIAILLREQGDRKLAAVVSDVADDKGQPLFVVLDPRERAAKEVGAKNGYRLLSSYQFGDDQVKKARQQLDLHDGTLGTAL